MRRREALRLVGGTAALTLGAAGGGRAAAERSETTLAPAGQLLLPGAKEVVVAGQTAFVAVTDGFAAVDLSNPFAPTPLFENRSVLAEHPDGPLTDVFDVAIDGDVLAVVGPAQAGAKLRAAVIYDVTDPTAPERVAVHETDFFNHNCAVADGTVFLCGNDGERNALVTVDAATGERLGDWSIVSQEPAWADVPFGVWPLHDVTVQDGVAYLAQWDAGTWMLDVSDPAAPTPIGRVRGQPASDYVDADSSTIQRAQLQPPGNDHFVAPNDDGSLVCISVEAWDIGAAEADIAPGALHLYDVTDPTAPRQLSTIPAPETQNEGYDGVWTTSHNFEIRGDMLVSSWYQGGVRSYDISDPTEPILTGAFRDAEMTSFWTAQHVDETFFVASSRGVPGESGADVDNTEAALFTFRFPDATATPGTPTATETSTPTDTPTATATATPADTPSSTPTAPATTTTNGQSGFGALAALAGLGAGAWRLLRD